MENIDQTFSENPSGFQWGGMVVTRVASHDRFGTVVDVMGKRNGYRIRVSPGGLSVDIQEVTITNGVAR